MFMCTLCLCVYVCAMWTYSRCLLSIYIYLLPILLPHTNFFLSVFLYSKPFSTFLTMKNDKKRKSRMKIKLISKY